MVWADSADCVWSILSIYIPTRYAVRCSCLWSIIGRPVSFPVVVVGQVGILGARAGTFTSLREHLSSFSLGPGYEDSRVRLRLLRKPPPGPREFGKPARGGCNLFSDVRRPLTWSSRCPRDKLVGAKTDLGLPQWGLDAKRTCGESG